MGIIEETAFANGISDFGKAADQVKYEVYKQTLKRIFITLNQPPVLEYLKKVLEGLQAIEDGFYDLISKGFQGYDLTIVLKDFIQAKSYLESVVQIYGIAGRELDFFVYKGYCRMKINEIMLHLR